MQIRIPTNEIVLHVFIKIILYYCNAHNVYVIIHVFQAITQLLNIN